MPSPSPIVHRAAVRLLVVDRDGRVLLQHCITPDTHVEFWCTPGGALQETETAFDAARRELLEETGLRESIREQRWWRWEELRDVAPALLNPPELPALLAHLQPPARVAAPGGAPARAQ